MATPNQRCHVCFPIHNPFRNEQLERKVGMVDGVGNWGQPEKLQLNVEGQIRKAETDKNKKGKGGREREASSPAIMECKPKCSCHSR